MQRIFLSTGNYTLLNKIINFLPLTLQLVLFLYFFPADFPIKISFAFVLCLINSFTELNNLLITKNNTYNQKNITLERWGA